MTIERVEVVASFRGGPFNGRRLKLEYDSPKINFPTTSNNRARYYNEDEPVEPVQIEYITYIRDWVTLPLVPERDGVRRGRAAYSLEGLG